MSQESGSTSTIAGDILNVETMITPHRNFSIARSEGIRKYPSMKFSQVGFVAIIVGVFRNWRVDPTSKTDESQMEIARKRVLNIVKNDKGQVILI